MKGDYIENIFYGKRITQIKNIYGEKTKKRLYMERKYMGKE